MLPNERRPEERRLETNVPRKKKCACDERAGMRKSRAKEPTPTPTPNSKFNAGPSWAGHGIGALTGNAVHRERRPIDPVLVILKIKKSGIMCMRLRRDVGCGRGLFKRRLFSHH
jgi:hypothetical protein